MASFKIAHIELHEFRSFVSFEDEVAPKTNIVLGANARGKTNLIEAIQLLTMLESFRNPSWDDVVHWGAAAARTDIGARSENRSVEVGAVYTKEGRSFHYNGNRRQRGELLGLIPGVLFTPDDLYLVKGAPQKRRVALDALGEQLSPIYYRLRTDYERVVAQRNKLLKDSLTTRDILASWTDSLISMGMLLLQHRQNLFKIVSGHMNAIFPSLAPEEEFSLSYQSSWGRQLQSTSNFDEADVRRLYTSELLQQEREQHMSLYGPHRDEINFFIGSRDARRYASQGQQRTIALAWKLAEVETILEVSGKLPVLLLDDVMSELDETRRHALVAYVGQRDLQSFITSANREYFSAEMLQDAHVIDLNTP